MGAQTFGEYWLLFSRKDWFINIVKNRINDDFDN